ncbi:hypothetical protein Vafri_21182, partial [Volvox africanus]
MSSQHHQTEQQLHLQHDHPQAHHISATASGKSSDMNPQQERIGVPSSPFLSASQPQQQPHAVALPPAGSAASMLSGLSQQQEYTRTEPRQLPAAQEQTTTMQTASGGCSSQLGAQASHRSLSPEGVTSHWLTGSSVSQRPGSSIASVAPISAISAAPTAFPAMPSLATMRAAAPAMTDLSTAASPSAIPLLPSTFHLLRSQPPQPQPHPSQPPQPMPPPPPLPPPAQQQSHPQPALLYSPPLTPIPEATPAIVPAFESN